MIKPWEEMKRSLETQTLGVRKQPSGNALTCEKHGLTSRTGVFYTNISKRYLAFNN